MDRNKPQDIIVHILSVTYASSPSSDLLISTLEFNNEAAGAIRLAQSFIETP